MILADLIAAKAGISEARGGTWRRRGDRAADQGGDDGLGVGERNRLEVRRASHRSSAGGRSDRCLEARSDP